MSHAIKSLITFWTLFFLCCTLRAPKINEYVITRAFDDIVIDGTLSESDWERARCTEAFVYFEDGSEPVFLTQAKILWDDTHLYIAFICQDDDVWSKFCERDRPLWHGEAVEIFCDPDGDGLNYIEIQINPLGAVLDLLMDKAYFSGGTADRTFEFADLEVGVSVNGTLNDLNHNDTLWSCEVALPFRSFADFSPSINVPPEDGDSWRLNLCRYERQRTGRKITEITCWNQTDRRGFHVPEKFGSMVFRKNVP